MKAMTQLLAVLFLLLLSTLNGIASMWFTFGIWPVRYWPLLVFSMTGALLYSAMTAIGKSK